jgi:hypothetical protein
MNNENLFEIILLILKIVIILLWILDIYLKYSPANYRILDINKERYLSERVSVVFEILIAFLLIYLFNPFYHHQITKMTKFTLFMFGIMTIVKFNWSKFISDSPLIKYL